MAYILLCLYTPFFYLIIILLSPFPSSSVFFFRCVAFVVLPLSSCLGCIALLIGLLFSRSLLTRMFFLLYAYHVVVFMFWFLSVLSCLLPYVCFPCFFFSEHVQFQV